MKTVFIYILCFFSFLFYKTDRVFAQTAINPELQYRFPSCQSPHSILTNGEGKILFKTKDVGKVFESVEQIKQNVFYEVDLSTSDIKKSVPFNSPNIASADNDGLLGISNGTTGEIIYINSAYIKSDDECNDVEYYTLRKIFNCSAKELDSAHNKCKSQYEKRFVDFLSMPQNQSVVKKYEMKNYALDTLTSKGIVLWFINKNDIRTTTNNKIYNYNISLKTDSSTFSTPNPSFTLYPNPVSSILSIKSLNLASGKYIINISDEKAKLLTKEILIGSYDQIDEINMESIASGNYVLTVINSKGNIIYADRVIKNNIR